MSSFDRRRFLKTSAAAAALSSSSLRSLAQAAAAKGAAIALHPERNGPHIPASFIGLSYEIEQLSDPTYFTGTNTGLIEQFRALAPAGVLRLGGNTSDVGWWKATAASQPPQIQTRTVVGEPNASLAFAVTPEAVKNLRAFLDATGWKAIYGINLGTGTPARAAEEATAVAAILGDKLEYFQLGNEPDLFKNHLRDPKTWSVDLYLDEWLAMANAVRARVPQARFGLPDTSGNPEWSSRIAQRLSAMPSGTGQGSRPNLAALTHHYYFGGPPSNPDVNITRLLKTDPRVARVAGTTKDAADQLGVPYRMTEGNTCYRGGKPGVSDVLASALWAADYVLSLASFGYAGVNLHGGSAKQVANSLGGTLPGDALVPATDPPHPRPYYTPIADINGGYVPQPDYKGLQFAQHFAGATLIPVDFDPGDVNATAYAAKSSAGQVMVAIINKDATNPLPLNLPGFTPLVLLTGPALDSRNVDLKEPQGNNEANAVPPATAMLLVNTHG